ncbi:MAG: cation transporter [bacterium]|nr:MAG: cation transporter [bacterium]
MLWFKKEREKEGWLLASILLNLFFSAAKLFWGWWVGSTVVTADGIHSISDVFGAFLVFLALRYAGHKSGRFPFGMNKLEDLAATLGSFAIVLAGYEIIRTVLFSGGIETPENIWATLSFIVILIVLEFVFYFFERKAARRLESPGVRADALNWLGDMGASGVVIAGILGYHFSIPYAQEVAVVIIVLMIFYGAYEILRNAVLSLLDASVDTQTLRKARSVIDGFPDVVKTERLFIRRSGSVLIADIVLQVKEKNTQSAHLLVDRIEQKLYRQIPNLVVTTIHYEPEKNLFKKVALLLDETKINIAKIFEKSAWIELREMNTNGELLNSKFVRNPVSQGQHDKAIKLAAWLIKQQVNQIVFNPIDMEEDLRTLFSALDIQIAVKV